MIKTNEHVRQEQTDYARNARDARTVDQIFQAYPIIIRNEANANLILADLYTFISAEDSDADPPTLSWFQCMLAANPSYLKRLATTTEDKRKAALVDAIMDLLINHGPKQFPEMLENERKRLSLPQTTIQYLEERLAQIKERQRLARMSVGQIQAEINASRPQPQRVVLPSEYTVRKIKSMPADGIRALIDQFGREAVNSRLFGKS